MCDQLGDLTKAKDRWLVSPTALFPNRVSLGDLRGLSPDKGLVRFLVRGSGLVSGNFGEVPKVRGGSGLFLAVERAISEIPVWVPG